MLGRRLQCEKRSTRESRITAEVLSRVPGCTMRDHCLPILDERRDSDRAHDCESLHKAGVPK